MSSLRSPEVPQYRVTLFYGPEAQPGPPPAKRCVFNVKKRSWKGGVQVAVDVEESQLRRAGDMLQFESWLKTILSGVPQAEQPDYEARARDLFIQGICALKLDHALDALCQGNTTVAGDRLTRELDRAISEQSARLKATILSELDLATRS